MVQLLGDTHTQQAFGGCSAFGSGLGPEDTASEDFIEGQCSLAVGHGVRGKGIPQLGDEEEVCRVP